MNQRNTRSNGIATTPTDAFLESISDGVFTVDLEWRITSFNRAAEEITGMSRKEAIGRLCPEVFRSSMCEAECALRRTLKTGRPVIGRSGFIINADGTRISISVSTAVLRDAGGRVVGGAETFRDLSEVIQAWLSGNLESDTFVMAGCSGRGRGRRRGIRSTGKEDMAMPRGDGTGPMGMGARTGRAAGYCAGSEMPGYAHPVPGRGSCNGILLKSYRREDTCRYVRWIRLKTRHSSTSCTPFGA